jgi:hypothetical protein
MRMKATCWRINPPPNLQFSVEKLARQENRSTSNLLTILVREALQHRGALGRAPDRADSQT